MKGSDGVLWVTVAQEMKSGSGQLDPVKGNEILKKLYKTVIYWYNGL